jgi:EmrB/QacA subfamily drug resistance transporter
MSEVGFRSERGPVLIAIMLSTALVAIDSTIIATAVPSIVHSIGGFTEFPWLFSIYLLAQAVTVPVYGKLADLFGRKPLLLFGIGLFLFGSIMCGIAWNMTVLIAFRAVQGVGAGAVQPMSITIVGDLYSVAERAKVQGYVASVWGIAAVIGPALGGVFSEYVSWRWIFFVNIPVCLLAAGMIVRRFDERRRTRGERPRIDYRGAALLTGGLILVTLGILEGGQSWAWDSLQSVLILTGGAGLLVAFVIGARRTPDPVLPLWVFRRRLLAATSIASAAVGAIVIGLSSYMPTYVQDVLGTGPVVAGFALATLTIGWPLSASQAGKIYLRTSFRTTALIGGAIAVLGTALLLLLGRHSSVLQVGATCFVIGIGMGLIAPPTLVAAQSSVGWSERGVVTGANLFSRSLGSAVGVAIFGAIANATLGTSGANGAVDPDRLTIAVHHVFAAVTVLAVVMALIVLLMPRNGGPHAAPSTPAQEPAGAQA